VIKFLKILIGKFGLRVGRQSELFNFRLVNHIKRLGISQILDVGANVGQFYFELKSAGYSGNVTSFEPLPDAHEILVSISKNRSDWNIYDRVAIGSSVSSIMINVANNSASSSIRSQTELMKQNATFAKEIQEIEVNMTTLDNATKHMTYLNYALKIDTQGYELEVLKGATETLKQVRLISIELPLAELYKGQAKYHHIDEYLRLSGFRLIDLYPGFKNFDTGEVFEYDAIYEKIN